MVVTDAGMVHAVWEEGVRIYHSIRVEDTWTTPGFVATGESPSLALAKDGSVHLVFGNVFGGDHNVFYVVWRNGLWTLPRLVSKTSGLSASPSIALDSDEVVHAVWEDTTPGYLVIYHGWLDGTWLNEPLTNARGSAPVLAQDSTSALLHLAWQMRGPEDGPHDIYYSQGTTYSWSVPQNISVTSGGDSTSVRLACDLDGRVHLVWREQGPQMVSIGYSGGREGNWPLPENISGEVADASDPALAAAPYNQLHVVWQEDRAIIHRSLSGATHNWRPSQAVIAGESGVGQMALAAAPSGDVHLLWVSGYGEGPGDIYHSIGPRVLPYQVFLPTVTGSGL
jgi:hypothetical protein